MQRNVLIVVLPQLYLLRTVLCQMRCIQENAKDRKWVWGGCVIHVGGDTDHCNDCGKSFGGDFTSEEKLQAESFDEESFLKDREKLFNAIDKFLDEERDEDLYAQALNEAEGDEVEAGHIYFRPLYAVYR